MTIRVFLLGHLNISGNSRTFSFYSLEIGSQIFGLTSGLLDRFTTALMLLFHIAQSPKVFVYILSATF